MKQNIGFVIPSYYESENIVELISKIKMFESNATIIIVDDSNKKENLKLQKLIKTITYRNNQNIKLISRFDKNGRGSAVLTGFRELFKNDNIEYFFELDADLSHDPLESVRLLKKIKEKNADMVIGSRYLDKSKITKWPIKRRILSKLINFIINIWLGLKLSDYTNGFRLYNRGSIEYLLNINLKEKGFIALSEIAFRLKQNNFKIVEVPISFTDRKYGKSSAGLLEYKNSILGIIRIRIFPIEYKK